MNKDQADKYLPIETDFVCKNNPPSWYGCRKCKRTGHLQSLERKGVYVSLWE